ncbi:ATP-binding protein [Actinoplanes sp. TRM 88003]|uniref:histidine kinase n=1 Tax=Paractinoplanes aksuensis TaxID=2939490 RepID=A0ABT1DZD4_9ACTN|nr:ATP-binding protein [Actinoplanes aksuensis]MCO8276212.1 ATP-binding protein [Actinoplanes aksuensis]
MVVLPYVIAAVSVLGAALFAVRVSRDTGARPGERRAPAAESRSELADTRSALAAARAEVDQLTARLQQAQAGTAATAREPARHAQGRHVEVFVNLSRRLQSLVHREIKLLDALENEVEDPDLLKGLFQVDHLATRIRRHAENLAVLGGSVSRRQWSRPVALTEVLRSAIAEVEHYSRVKLVPPIEGTLPGHAVASVIHLISELIENATMFAPPHTQVLLRAQPVASGLAIEVEDRGLGMQPADLHRVNQLLVNPDDTNLDDLLRDGRIGLYVVSMIARQHGVVVQLQTNIYGGIQAVMILPPTLIGSALEAAPEMPRLAPPPERLEVPGRPPLERRVPLQQRIPVRETLGNHQAAETSSLPHAGRGHAEARPIAVAAVPAPPVPDAPARPPLPRRRRQTHMAPQLQLGPPDPVAEPAGDHHPGLMASFMSGVSQGEADPPGSGRHD